jgi:alpha-beta hydrolase superfamily lysophospholipase
VSAPYRVRQGYLHGNTADLLLHVHEQQEPAPVVVISGALGVSCTEPRYLMTLLAHRLADGGATVVQYDHPADGDSTGNPRTLEAADLLGAGWQVLDFAAGLSSGPLAVVGYGAGNVVAAWLLGHTAVCAGVLLAPCARAWSRDWVALCPPASDGLIAPTVTPDGTGVGDIWRALYGEPVVPSQPPGPVGIRLLTEVARLNPYAVASSRRDDSLVISDLETDLDGVLGTGLRLAHRATPEQPSWHWNLANRTIVIDAVTDWIGCRCRLGPIADDQPVGEPARTRATTHADGARSQDALQATTRAGTATARRVVVEDDAIFGILRRPDGPAARSGPCVIYETGNPGQRVDIHRCGPVLAERLAAHGLASFRYDPRGMGTSQGNYQDMTWSRRVEDLAAVIAALDMDGFHPIVILGNSAGARVGLRAAAEDPRIAGLVLWGPILRESVEESAEPSLIRVPGGLATEWCGLPLGLRYQRDVRDHDDLAAFTGGNTPTCVIFADDEPDQANLRAVLAAVRTRRGVTVMTAPGQHGFTWSGLHEAITHSVRWIQATLLGGDVS